MLKIKINEAEMFDNKTNRFIKIPETELILEHSLLSISKWESKWCKRFLSPSTKLTPEQNLDYIRCMTITKNVDPNVYYGLTQSNMDEIAEYISRPMTATTFNERKPGPRNGEEVSSELIYYWMTAYSIPWEAEKWPLNRLMTLIKIANIKNQPSNKMSKADLYKHYAKTNAANRARMHSKG